MRSKRGIVQSEVLGDPVRPVAVADADETAMRGARRTRSRSPVTFGPGGRSQLGDSDRAGVANCGECLSGLDSVRVGVGEQTDAIARVRDSETRLSPKAGPTWSDEISRTTYAESVDADGSAPGAWTLEGDRGNERDVG